MSNVANQGGQKLIKIAKKKSSSSNLTIKIISNNGHSSLVGLTSILIYSLSGDLLTVDELILKNANPKLLKLFT